MGGSGARPRDRRDSLVAVAVRLALVVVLVLAIVAVQGAVTYRVPGGAVTYRLEPAWPGGRLVMPLGPAGEFSLRTHRTPFDIVMAYRLPAETASLTGQGSVVEDLPGLQKDARAAFARYLGGRIPWLLLDGRRVPRPRAQRAPGAAARARPRRRRPGRQPSRSAGLRRRPRGRGPAAHGGAAAPRAAPGGAAASPERRARQPVRYAGRRPSGGPHTEQVVVHVAQEKQPHHPAPLGELRRHRELQGHGLEAVDEVLQTAKVVGLAACAEGAHERQHPGHVAREAAVLDGRRAAARGSCRRDTARRRRGRLSAAPADPRRRFPAP